MISTSSANGLHLNTSSQLTSQCRLQRGVSTSSSSSLSPGSPGSWKNSLEELSKGLQRICSSPSKELLQTPLAATRYYAGINSSVNGAQPGVAALGAEQKRAAGSVSSHGVGLRRQTSENLFVMPTPAAVTSHTYSALLGDANGRRSLRVKHEETNDTLQRRLSQISGYKLMTSQDDMNANASTSATSAAAALANSKAQQQPRLTSKELALKVTRRLSASQNRINVTVDVGDGKQEHLTVRCHDGKLIVFDVTKASSSSSSSSSSPAAADTVTTHAPTTHGDDDGVLYTDSVPKDSMLSKIMCFYGAHTLHIRERTRAVLTLDVGKAAASEPFYCPIFTWSDDHRQWKMTWYLSARFNNQSVGVKTVDSRLVIVCRSKRLSSSLLTATVTGHMETQHELLRSADDVINGGLNGVRQRGCGVQMSLDLPEGVDPRTVTAYVTDDGQLVVEGQHTGNTDRCMTL